MQLQWLGKVFYTMNGATKISIVGTTALNEKRTHTTKLGRDLVEFCGEFYFWKVNGIHIMKWFLHENSR